MKRGLVVDNSAVIRMVAGRILGMLRFQSEEVDGPAKALERCERSMPDVILVDGARTRVEIAGFPAHASQHARRQGNEDHLLRDGKR